MKISQDTAVGIACGVLLMLGFHSLVYFVSAMMNHHCTGSTPIEAFNSVAILIAFLALGRNQYAIRALKWSLIYFAVTLNLALMDLLLRKYIFSSRGSNNIHFSELNIEIWFAWSILCILSLVFLYRSEKDHQSK